MLENSENIENLKVTVMKDIILIKEKVFKFYNPIIVFYSEGSQREYDIIFDRLAGITRMKRKGFKFQYELIVPNQALDRELSHCFYIYNSRSKDRLEGYDAQCLDMLKQCTNGNVVMVCLLKITNFKNVKTIFFQQDLEELKINSGFDLNSETLKELMVPRIILDSNGEKMPEKCPQNDDNFKLLENALERMLRLESTKTNN